MWRPFTIALALLTRIPVRAGPGDARSAGRSVLWYPAVGLLIGCVIAGVCLLARTAPPLVVAALALFAWCLVTGGLHLDGLSDSADAFVGGHGDPARTLAIMQDPAAGPMGVAAVCTVLLLKYSALATHVAAETWWPILLAPVLGRASVVALLLVTPYVRPGGLGETPAAMLPRRPACLMLVGVAAASAIPLGMTAIVAAAVLFLLLRRLLLRTIGGTTGDTAGALVESTETLILLAAVFPRSVQA